ncbi:hypothetical protein ACH4F6_37990 [Streptomyces sp. NPDC017936]|uniref:hypothetical protein n=1 Tax=Streptomyces sp. NPDC017936 TaxID=3365016 RepID=UPI0037A8DA6B
MTSYSVERPARRRPGTSRVRPGPAHLRPGEATTGQPVTIRTLGADGGEVEFPAVFVRMDGNRLHLRCIPVGEDTSRRYRPSQVFPRRVTYRRWTVTLKHRAVAPDGDGRELLPVLVSARTELEARYEAVKQVHARYGESAAGQFTLHSVKREG